MSSITYKFSLIHSQRKTCIYPRYTDRIQTIICDMLEDRRSIVTGRNRDCLACKLVSGGGLIGAGLYIAHHSKTFNKYTGKSIMFALSAVVGGLGVARILDLPPFSNHLNPNESR